MEFKRDKKRFWEGEFYFDYRPERVAFIKKLPGIHRWMPEKKCWYTTEDIYAICKERWVA